MAKLTTLSRRELEAINRKNFKYPLAIAEKDYFLALVSKIIYDSPLRNKLVFKGGTALHHCYLNQMRFSEALDFTSLDRSISIGDIIKALAPHEFLSIKKEHTSRATIKIERLSYEGPLNQSNSLKLEIDYFQNVVLPARVLSYKNVWRVDTKARVMDISEIAAEKIKAASDRARYQDFYDLFQILKNFKLDIGEVISLVGQKEFRKTIQKESILANWEVARQEKAGGRHTVYYSEEVNDAEIEEMIEKLAFDKIKNRD